MKALITRKIGMTSTIADDGVMQAVTLLSASPNTVTQIKDLEKDGYFALQLGFESTTKHGKAQTGHLKPSKSTTKVAREIRVNQLPEDLSVGSPLAADVFSVGDTVHVTSTSKGKGWAGTIKRHNFHRGRKTHGGGSYRRPGSIGSMYPQKIMKGKKMAGAHGSRASYRSRNLKVALVDTELAVIGVTGAVPGPRKGLVVLKGAES